MEPFAVLAERARQSSLHKERERRIVALVQEIDQLSGEMGVSAFVEATRKLGYNIDADTGMLLRRGVDITQH
jgi:hypothetical protein